MPMLPTQAMPTGVPPERRPQADSRGGARLALTRNIGPSPPADVHARDKLRILAATDRATASGGIGAILRREGVYSSTLCDWRRQRDAGAFGALLPGKRGPKAPDPSPLTAEVRISGDNAHLRAPRSRRSDHRVQKNELGSAARL